jgi:hypothetical protein
MKLFKKLSAFISLAVLSALLPVHAFAEAGRPACLQINAAQVDVVTVIDRELHAGTLWPERATDWL